MPKRSTNKQALRLGAALAVLAVMACSLATAEQRRRRTLASQARWSLSHPHVAAVPGALPGGHRPSGAAATKEWTMGPPGPGKVRGALQVRRDTNSVGNRATPTSRPAPEQARASQVNPWAADDLVRLQAASQQLTPPRERRPV